MKLGPSKFAYTEFYIREFPEFLNRYEKEFDEYQQQYRICLEEAKVEMETNNTNSNFVIPPVLSEPLLKVPSIYDWVNSKLSCKASQNEVLFQILFETTRKVWRLFEIFASEGQLDFQPTSSYCSSLTKKKGDSETVDMIVDSNILDIVDHGIYSSAEEYYMINTNMNLFEKIVFCLKEECLGRDEIKKLPLGFSLPIQEVLNHDYFKTIYAKSNPKERKIIQDWPKEIFKLIEREDLFYNFQEMRK
jgi:hypothetical protein